MKKIITSASLAALGALSLQAGTPLDRSYYAPNPALTPQERTKWWSVSAKVTPGPHSFCYVIDDSIHLADYAAHGVRMDGSGHWVSELKVA